MAVATKQAEKPETTDNPGRSDLVPMIGPDGTARLVPSAQVHDLLLRGARVGLLMQPPNGGDPMVVRFEDAERAQNSGGKLLQNDGSEYPEGQAPKIVGHNASGEPIWGNTPRVKEGFLKSFGEAFANGVKGFAKFLDPRATDEERQKGLTSFYDDALRPFERLTETQIGQGKTALDAIKEARRTGKMEDVTYAAGNALAALTPAVGPWAAQVAEKAGGQIGEGDISGAAGTLAGNAAFAAANDVALKAAPKVIKAAPEAIRAVPGALRGRFAEMIAPRARLDAPIAPGKMTPYARYRAARRAGVNPDLAQATTARGPEMAKTVNSRTVTGRGVYRNNVQGNLKALHDYAGQMLDEAHPENLSREEFGNRVKQTVSAHRAALADEPGARAQAQAVLDKMAPDAQTGEEFGEESQQNLKRHQEKLYEGAQEDYGNAFKGKNSQITLGGTEAAADRILDDNFDYYKDNPESLKLPKVKAVLDQILPKASASARHRWLAQFEPGRAAKEAPGAMATGRSTPTSTPANVAMLRSDLMDLYRDPEIVKQRPGGWLKQMVAALDGDLTNPANERGMTPAQIHQFRAGNTKWEEMKTMYDDPQSPFFSIVRSPEPLTAAKTLEGLKPVAARQFRKAMSDIGQPKMEGKRIRQAAVHILDPTSNGIDVNYDLPGFRARWQKLPKEQIMESFGPDHTSALDALAERAGKTTPYDVPGSRLAAVADAPDGLAASRAIFADNGALRLTPEDVRLLEQADQHVNGQAGQQGAPAGKSPSAPDGTTVVAGTVGKQRVYAVHGPDGNIVGKLSVQDVAPGKVEISGASTRVHGNGFGRKLYEETIKAENAKGNTVVSSQEGNTSPEAARVWDGLVSRGVARKVGDTYEASPGAAQEAAEAPEDTGLMGQLKRQAIGRVFDPAENGVPDMRNFSSRWNRAQKEPLSAVLSPEQLKDLDDMSEVSHMVQADENASGTSTVLVPSAELGGLYTHPHIAVPEMAGQYGAAKLMNSPRVVESVMEHPKPEPLSTVTEPLTSAARETAAETLKKPVTPEGAAVTAVAAGQGAREQGSKTAPAQREGVSTPPNGGQVTDVDRAEPNEVHDEAAAQAEMQREAPGSGGGPVSTGTGGTGGVSSLRDASGRLLYSPATGTTPEGVESGFAKPALPPEGATHEVLHPDTQEVIGHVVNGEWVPLAQ